MKCCEGLKNRASNIIRRYIDHTDCANYIGFLFIPFFYILWIPFFIIVCMDVRFVFFCLIL